MKIKPQTAVIASILFVVAGIIGSMALGWWQTESNKIPPILQTPATTEVTKPGETGAPAGETVTYDPAGIKGSFTFGEVSSLYGIPLEDLADAFVVDRAAAESFKVKELETIYTDKTSEVGTSSMRLFVAWYKGLPYELKEDSFLPAPAVEILREKAKLTPEQEEYLNTHTLSVQE